MTMRADGFFVMGTTHHRAPLAVREKLALTAAGETALRAELGALPGLREYAMLNTCNRVEFYGVATDPDVAVRIAAAFCARQQFDPEEFGRICLNLSGGEAVQHLLEVAAGLDSQVIGETEIFGQVKAAYAAAQAHGSAGAVLNRVFQKGFQAAKHVRTHTAITEGQISVANIAVDLALKIFGGLKDVRILLVGAGEIGEKTARAFQSRGAAAVTVSSRRFERAMELATALGASAMPFEQCHGRLAEFDVVVCATSAPDPVVSFPDARTAMHRRPAQPLFFIDLALPRDVDPAVTDIDNVFLYNLDDLAKIADENRAARQAELVKGRAILAQKADVLWRHIAPQVAALRASTPAPAAHPPPAAGTGMPESPAQDAGDSAAAASERDLTPSPPNRYP